MEVISGAVFSDAGQFAFAVAVSFVLVAFSLFVAYQQAQYVTGIPDRVKFQGRKPTRASSIKRRLDIVKGVPLPTVAACTRIARHCSGNRRIRARRSALSPANSSSPLFS